MNKEENENVPYVFDRNFVRIYSPAIIYVIHEKVEKKYYLKNDILIDDFIKKNGDDIDKCYYIFPINDTNLSKEEFDKKIEECIKNKQILKIDYNNKEFNILKVEAL
jgi:hypothetical protein